MSDGKTGAQRLRRAWRRIRLLPWQQNLCIIIAAEITALVGFSISVPFLPFYIQELGTTRFEDVAFWVGLINSAAAVSMALAAPIWGMVADRYGRKPMLVRSMIGGGIILSLMSLASSAPQVAILRIIQGTLSGSVAAATTLVATTVPDEHRGYALGLLQTSIFASHSLGPLVGGALAAVIGYRAVFVTSGVLLFSAMLIVARYVHEDFTPPPPRAKRSKADAAPARAIFSQPVLLTMLGMLMLNNLAGQVTIPNLSLFVQTLVSDTKVASTFTGAIVGGTAMANAIAAVWVGRSANRLGRRRVLLACLGLGALSYIPQMFTTHPLQLLVLRFFTGLTMGGLIPVANAVIAEYAPEGRQGSIYGISASLNAAGRALGPILGTLVVTNVAITAMFPLTATLLWLGAAIVWLATRSVKSLDVRSQASPEQAR